MVKRNVLFNVVVLVLLFLIFSQSDIWAQCPMCKTSLEKARENGGTQVGNTLNAGILYLFVFPYIIVGGFGYIYYRNYKKKKLGLKTSANDSNQS